MEGKKMKAVIQTAQGKWEYSADTMDIPVPGSGQVLIKVEAGVINPVDLIVLNNRPPENPPQVPGSEGSGTVLESGGGIAAWMLTGKRVGFSVGAGGSWGEYVVADAMKCVALAADASWEQGACSFVNPLTAIGFVETA